MTDILRIKRRALGGSAGAPSSLAVGELAFNEVDGGLYIGRSNSSVVQINSGGGGAATAVADTPPGSPTNGQLWWESDTGTLWIYYNDGNTTQWVAATSGVMLQVGMPVQLQRSDVSAGTTFVAFTGIDGTYDEYELRFYGYRASVESQLNLQVSQDNGATWKTDATYVIGLTYVGGTGSGQFVQAMNSTCVLACPANVTANGAGSGIIRFNRPNIAEYHLFNVDATSYNSTLSFMSAKGVGGYSGNTAAINGIRLLPNSGTFNSGTFILNGIKK